MGSMQKCRAVFVRALVEEPDTPRWVFLLLPLGHKAWGTEPHALTAIGLDL